MTILDWSDPEEMLGLLAEYIRDALQEEYADERRAAFLRQLSRSVESLARRADLPGQTLLVHLRDIYDAQPAEFVRDAVLIHVHDCIDELSRIVAQSI